MTSMRSEPCNWPLAYCGESQESTGLTDYTQCPTLAGISPTMAALVERMATAYLWNWTGRQFGTCPITIRPCKDSCLDSWTTYRGRGGANAYLPWTEGGYGGPLAPGLINGQWYNFGCGGNCDTDPCSCTYVPTITLAGPVESVSEVRINGVVLATTSYRLDNHSYLVRTDGSDWPVCQDMNGNPLTDDDTFSVTYNIGVTVPAGGQVAAGVLACQMGKAACGDKGCQLPQRLQSLTRQGVTMTVLDSYGQLYMHGTTGLWIVDSWVASINASNKRAGMRIASPDRRPTRRTT